MNGTEFGNTVDGYMPVPYLTAGTAYTMRVRAVDAAGNRSALSDSVLVATQQSTVSPGAVTAGRFASDAISLCTHGAMHTVELGQGARENPVTVILLDLRGTVVARYRGIRAGSRIDISGESSAARIAQVRCGETVRVVLIAPR
jgi:hypothetical protein